MTWRETSPMEERIRFVKNCRSGLYEMSEFCDGYGISLNERGRTRRSDRTLERLRGFVWVVAGRFSARRIQASRLESQSWPRALAAIECPSPLPL